MLYSFWNGALKLPILISFLYVVLKIDETWTIVHDGRSIIGDRKWCHWGPTIIIENCIFCSITNKCIEPEKGGKLFQVLVLTQGWCKINICFPRNFGLEYLGVRPEGNLSELSEKICTKFPLFFPQKWRRLYNIDFYPVWSIQASCQLAINYMVTHLSFKLPINAKNFFLNQEINSSLDYPGVSRGCNLSKR